MRLLDNILSERRDLYKKPFFAMSPKNFMGFKKKTYKGYKVKYYNHIEKDVVLFGEMKFA